MGKDEVRLSPKMKLVLIELNEGSYRFEQPTETVVDVRNISALLHEQYVDINVFIAVEG